MRMALPHGLGSVSSASSVLSPALCIIFLIVMTFFNLLLHCAMSPTSSFISASPCSASSSGLRSRPSRASGQESIPFPHSGKSQSLHSRQPSRTLRAFKSRYYPDLISQIFAPGIHPPTKQSPSAQAHQDNTSPAAKDTRPHSAPYQGRRTDLKPSKPVLSVG